MTDTSSPRDAAGTPAASPLDSYAPDPRGAALHRVALLRLPVRLAVAGREHHDGLTRELRLLALSEGFMESDAPARLLELVAILGEQYATARERQDEEIDAALARDEDAIDQVMETPATAAVAARALVGLLDEADVFCEQATLMTLPRPPLLRRFSDWYLHQVIDQIEGKPPQAWDGPLQP